MKSTVMIIGAKIHTCIIKWTILRYFYLRCSTIESNELYKGNGWWWGNLYQRFIKKYSKRLAKYENLTLADCAAWYDHTGKRYVKQTVDLDFDGLPLESFVDNNQNDDEEIASEAKETKRRSKTRLLRVDVCKNRTSGGKP